MDIPRASALVFLGGSEPPSREAIDGAVKDLDAEPIWRGEGERGPDLVVRVDEDQRVAVNLLAEPAPEDAYLVALEISGLEDDDMRDIRGHRWHARCFFLDTDALVDPSDRMTAVFRVAARLVALDGIAVMSPLSGVFAVGLRPEHVEGRMAECVPPLDLWIEVEMVDEDTARSVGASLVGVHDVKLTNVAGLDPDLVYESVLGAVAYLDRIRRELVPGEELQIGRQPWSWMTVKGKKGEVVLRRTEPAGPAS